MSLRARIFAGFALVLVAFVAVSAALVVAQRSQLIDELDKQLDAVAPINRAGPLPRPSEAASGDTTSPAPPASREPDDPISELYIAAIDADGTLEVIVRGQLLESDPAIDVAIATATVQRSFAMVEAAEGSTTFRVLFDPADAEREVAVIALPMSGVNDSTRQLVITLGVLAAFMGTVLALLAWWIHRLALRPIFNMTTTAAAIATGDREQRVSQLDQRTEVGQLSVTFNEMLDQRDRAEDRLRRFVSDASHELRTPLAAINGYTDLYLAGGFHEEGEIHDVIRRVQSVARRMTGLVETLLQLARLDEAQPLQTSPADIGTLICEVVNDSLAAHPGRNVLVVTDKNLPPVSIDRDKIYQVIAGLVTNALIHAPESDVEVRTERKGDVAHIEIADDGPGLTDDQAQHVFERFYRADPARATTTGGSGLGLAIADSITAAHGGSIHLTTGLGAGCKFIVCLPIDETAERTPSAIDPPALTENS